MNDDQLNEMIDQLSDEEAAEWERVQANLEAAMEMDDSPEKAQLFESLYRDAAAIDSAFHMFYSRFGLWHTLYARSEYIASLRPLAQAQHLAVTRADEIPDSVTSVLGTLVLMPLEALMEDVSSSRTTIEAYLQHLRSEAQRGKAGKAELALCETYWYSHIGERAACEDAYDRWMTAESPWWAKDSSLTIGLAAEFLGWFDPRAALEYLDRHIPTMTGKPLRVVGIKIDAAGWRAICGQPEQAWALMPAIMNDPQFPGLDEFAEDARLWSLVRAADAAPYDSSNPASPGAFGIAEVAAKNIDAKSADAILTGASIARAHLLRGNNDLGGSWRKFALQKAASYDARNGTGHQTHLLHTYWFHDL